jgi:hypothetical protein
MQPFHSARRHEERKKKLDSLYNASNKRTRGKHKNNGKEACHALAEERQKPAAYVRVFETQIECHLRTFAFAFTTSISCLQ